MYLLREFYQKSFINYGDYAGKHPEQLRHMTFISGHFGYDYVKDLMQSRYSFTFLRHPGERILSLFYFYLTRDPDQFPVYRLAHECSLEEFLEAGLKAGLVKEHIWNHQTWQLAHGWGSLSGKTLEDFGSDEILDMAMSHLQDFSYIGLTETFDADCRNILRALKINFPEKMAVVNATGPKLSVKDVSPRARALLEELTCLDRKIYDAVLVQRWRNNG